MSLSSAIDDPRDQLIGSGKDFVRASIKRVMDVVGATLLLIMLAPVFSLIALVISLDGGPAFFAHKRVGRGGKLFGCLKFRTMIVGAEELLSEYLALHPEMAEEWAREQKLGLDPRITGIGKLLRRTSFDELPQLVNVLRGEMSLVGPRPVTKAEIDEKYGAYARLCTSVRPGLTGLWQVSGRNDVSYPERVAMDVRYVTKQTILGDIRILFRTASVVLSRSGAR